MASGDVTQKFGAAAALTFTTLNSLANAGFAASNGVTVNGNLALDALVEIVIADNSETGNKQANVFVVTSVDGTNFGSSDAASRMVRIGTIDMTGTGPFRSQVMSIAAALGSLPYAFKIVVQNDSGAAFAASGNSGQYQLVYQNVAP